MIELLLGVLITLSVGLTGLCFILCVASGRDRRED